jgi:hypothetical protein
MMQNIYLNGMIKKEIRATPLYYRVRRVNSSLLVGGVSPHIFVELMSDMMILGA